ncbi:hypothetical protein BLNAU_13828 [Blattamonas nauphoetae]|uniref:Uncharacterized protein n=1 Tax=Blattamonas nauphoetae TaxID=2049346 RepID=A0ABQ9XIK9_9EUKA|nr:hypothetical protein BLNAU_13828 [Blattamonas nauphoetae]
MRLNALEFEANVQITVFYQTSGGQDHNNGKLTLFFPKPERSRSEGSFAEILADRTAAVFDVVDLGKAGHSTRPQFRVLAFGQIDKERRYQLACHHTATHLIHCAAHTVHQQHIWQTSAKTTVVQAHLDITHFAALKDEEMELIEDYTNKLATEELVLCAFSNM